MAEIINNTANTNYSFVGSSDTYSASSNSLPINFENSSGLIITKSATPETFVAGDIINYTVTITNSSSQFLNGVRIIDDLGGGNLAYVLSSASLQTSSVTYPVSPVSTNPLTFTLQQLAVGATITLRYKSQVIFNLPSTVSMITNSVRGIGYTASGTITGFANSTIERRNTADFSITKTANVTDVLPRQTFNYYLTLTNNTSITASPVRVTDNLPSNFTLVSVSLKIGNGPTTTLNATDYVISAGNIFSLPSATSLKHKRLQLSSLFYFYLLKSYLLCAILLSVTEAI